MGTIIGTANLARVGNGQVPTDPYCPASPSSSPASASNPKAIPFGSMQHFVTAIRAAIEERNWYAALSLALTIPDICGWLEDPGAPSQDRYVSWFSRFLGSKYTRPVGPDHEMHEFLSGQDCYALRCAFLHEGREEITNQHARQVLERFEFTVAPPGWIVHLNRGGTGLQLQVDIFCRDFAEAGEEWLRTVGSQPEILLRMSSLLRIRGLNGNPPTTSPPARAAKIKSDPKVLQLVATEFAERLDLIYGLFLDAATGFEANAERLAKGQQESSRLVSNPAELDDLPHFYGKGDPNDPNNVMLHKTTQGEYKARNARGGTNQRLLSQYLIVSIFHLWEVEYRARIATALGLEHIDDLKLLIMGDVRILRNQILKHRGIIGQDARRLKLLTQIKEGDAIALDDEGVEYVTRLIKSEIDALVFEATGVDPAHRTIWHIR